MPRIGIRLIFQIQQFGRLLEYCKRYRGNVCLSCWKHSSAFTSGIKLKYENTAGETHQNRTCFPQQPCSLRQPGPARQLIGVQLFSIDPSVFSDALARNVMLFHY